MILKIIALLVLFVSCVEYDAETVSVYQETNGWRCRAGGNMFWFTGENAEQRAHERCDTFLIYYNKLKLNEGAKP